MRQYKSLIASIPGISRISDRALIFVFDAITRFDYPNQLITFCGVEPSKVQSSTMKSKKCMVKHVRSYSIYSF